jgi:hypothetical protein
MKSHKIDKPMMLTLLEEIVSREDVPADIRDKAWTVFFEGFGPYEKQGRRPPDAERVWELIDFMEAEIAKGLSIHAAAEAAAAHTEGTSLATKRQSFPWTVRQIENIYNQTAQMEPVKPLK